MEVTPEIPIIASQLGDLDSIVELSIDRNTHKDDEDIEELITFLPRVPSLVNNLTSIHIEAPFYADHEFLIYNLSLLKNLKKMVLDGYVRIGEDGLKPISSLVKLETFFFIDSNGKDRHSTPLKGNTLAPLVQLPLLREIRISNTPLDLESFGWIGKVGTLEWLELIDVEYCDSSCMYQLDEIRNNLTHFIEVQGSYTNTLEDLREM